MVRESGRRPWADLHPELLNLIYDKLAPVAAVRSTGFGWACKPWLQFHRSAAPLPPPPPDHHPYLPGDLLSSPTIDAVIPDKIRRELQAASVAYSWQSSGWLLLRRSHNGRIFSCFNPLFPYPLNYIKLPSRFAVAPPPAADPDSPPRIHAAFSSDPAGTDDWTVFVIGARRHTFSTFRGGDGSWKNYLKFNNPARWEGGCAAIGFEEGSFYCLFGCGDVLVFGIGEGGERRMLQGRRRGTFVVVSWKRVGNRGGGGRRWRLAGVERRRKEEAERIAEEMEEGVRWDSGVVFVGENRTIKIIRTWKFTLWLTVVLVCGGGE